jgi:holliday junction DNA helicase RuvA
MISHLYGFLRDFDPPHLVMDVGGVGYEISLPLQSCLVLSQSFAEKPEAILLYTHLSIREDAHQLYGFLSRRDRLLFRALIRVNGVGPKLALAILSAMDPLLFVASVLKEERNNLLSIPGVGRKMVERLMVELQDRFRTWPIETWTEGASLIGDKSSLAEDQKATALQALIRLGYKPKEAEKAIQCWGDEARDSEELIRTVLQHFGQEKMGVNAYNG